MNYVNFYKESIDYPKRFWQFQANQLDWSKSPNSILSKDKYDYNQWFEDGELNFFCVREQRPDQRQVPASDVDDGQGLPSRTSVGKLVVDDALHAWLNVEAVPAVRLGDERAQMVIIKDQCFI